MNTMMLSELRQAMRRRKVYVRVIWNADQDTYTRVTAKAFLQSIGGDVPYADDGLHDATVITAAVDGNEIYIG
jgi:hypothetical protein